MKHINVSVFVPHLGCPNNCIFCNQKTISGQNAAPTLSDVKNSCEIAIKTPHSINDSEIAFFGGSFTAIERDKMTEYLEAAQPYLGKYFGGIRISTRPDAIDEEVLEILKKYGVTAIELGAQSMCEDVLIKNERGHSPESTVKACSLIKEFGFSLGLQMMTGLYGSDNEKDIFTAKSFISLSPDTVRIYPTVVLKNTKLCTLFESGEYVPPTLGESVVLCSKLLYMFESAGIKVIRLGLHSGGNVEDGFVAGSYHPAFRELCEGLIYRNNIEDIISGREKGRYTVFVNPKGISKAVGQKKCNVEYFAEKGYELKILQNSDIPLYRVEIGEDKKCI